jgi:hypothetical protein
MFLTRSISPHKCARHAGLMHNSQEEISDTTMLQQVCTHTQSLTSEFPIYSAPLQPPLPQPPPVPIVVAMEGKSPMNMPPPGSCAVLGIFTGHYADIEDFLTHYEHCCDHCNLTDGSVKIRFMRRYCSQDVREVLDGLLESYTCNWIGRRSAKVAL